MKRFLLIVSIFLTIAAHSQTKPGFTNAGSQNPVLRFYPNPATTVISFDFQRTFEKGFSIQIYNAVLGRKMMEQVVSAAKTTIDLGNFTRGVYVYQLFDRAGKLVETGKFQVSK